MPPGTWYSRVLASTPSIFGLSWPSARYFSRSLAKCARTTFSFFRSSPVSYSVPCRAATRLSVGMWLVPSASGLMAVSMMSAPASMPFRMDMDARPEV